FLHAAELSSKGGISDAKKWIEHSVHTRNAVQFDAPFGELHRKCRRMRPFFGATLNRFVWNEPRIAAATQIAPAGMRPARNVAFILIRDSDGEPVELDATRFGEMKNVFVAIVEKPL